MTEKVLVTGGFGLVGSQTVRRLAIHGHRVVATDLGTPAQRKAATLLPANAEAHWANLTDQADVDRLIAEEAPTAIVHLAAVIPPAIYRSRELGRRVNVDATAGLLRAAQAHPRPPRFVLASSNAVYGSRNPNRHFGRLTSTSPLRPADLYGAHKIEAENLLRASSLDWVILRLGGVISADPDAMPFNDDALFFESALPTDGRIHTVDVRDVASAFAAATTADVVGETLLIAGDDSAPAEGSWCGDGRSARAIERVARRPARRPRQRRKLALHRLVGHHPRSAGAVVPAPLVARDARGDARHSRVAALPDVADFAHREAVTRAQGRISGRAGSLCRSVGRGTVPAWRARAGLIDLHRVARPKHRHIRRWGEYGHGTRCGPG
jgi:nucleoside-diphosphate-sugar epimerase